MVDFGFRSCGRRVGGQWWIVREGRVDGGSIGRAVGSVGAWPVENPDVWLCWDALVSEHMFDRSLTAVSSRLPVLDEHSDDAIPWGEVEVEPEVRDWYLGLDDTDQARVRFHIDRLAQLGPLLDEPHTRQLDGKLRELRFFLAGKPTRITYWIATGRRIILLTVFIKERRRERREVRRARTAMKRCVVEKHVVTEE